MCPLGKNNNGPVNSGTLEAWNLYLISIDEDTVVFLGLKVFVFENSYMFPCTRNAQVTFVNNVQTIIINFLKLQTLISLIQTSLNEALGGTVVNRAMSSLYGGLFKIHAYNPFKIKNMSNLKWKLYSVQCTVYTSFEWRHSVTEGNIHRYLRRCFLSMF